jgi:ABC-type molybdate transport system ATPase subunit
LFFRHLRLSHPRLLLLDEPFSTLDDELKHGIIADLKLAARECRPGPLRDA